MSMPWVVAPEIEPPADGEVTGAERVEQDPVGGPVGGDAGEAVGAGGVVQVECGAGAGRERGLADGDARDAGNAAAAGERGRGAGRDGEALQLRVAGEGDRGRAAV